MDPAFSRLLQHLRRDIELEADQVDLLEPHVLVRELPKKGFLLKEGQLSRHMTFVAEGCLRRYSLDEAGRENVLELAIEEWWINDLYSYLTQTPSNYYIEALEPCILCQIHRARLEELYRKVPLLETFFRIKFQNAYVALQRRTNHLLSESAEARYKTFLATYRSIEQRVPQYMIASYLGITPEFLSKIRKKLAQG